MKLKPSRTNNHTSETKSYLINTIVKPDIIVPSGIRELDILIGGFKAEEITYIDGNSTLIPEIPHRLCVNTYRAFTSNTLYIDGGICADPYKIARYAQTMEVDYDEILDHVHISRAFTVYQLSTFIEELLENEIKKHEPRTLIIGKYPALFLDPDVPIEESQTILKNTLLKLHDLTSRYQLITVLTNHENRLYAPHIRNMIQASVHETVRMKDIEPCTHIDLLKQNKSTIIYHITEGQRRLEQFGMVM